MEENTTMQIEALSYASGQPISLAIESDVIRTIKPLEQTAHTKTLPYVGPGLVDLQINGYAGLDFNHGSMSPETVSRAVRAVWREGVTCFLPTIITNDDASIRHALRAVDDACGADPLADEGIAGVHLEGPFISPEDGPRGAHHRACVCAPSWDSFQRWQDAAGGRIRLLTLSPEWPNSVSFIERCAASGVIVSIGHTAATSEQVADAVAAGAKLSTHLGNGAHLTLPRHPNYLWEQLAQESLWCCMIADGFHLPNQVLKVIMKVKREQAIVVSDAVALAGMPPGAYSMPVGGQVVLTPAGRLHLAENPKLLAGSAQMLPHHISHLISHQLANLAESWDMGSTRPAALLGLPQAKGLAPGAPADLALFRLQNGRIQIEQTIKSGIIHV